MNERTKMECIRCHGFSSTRVCWSCSVRNDAIDFSLLESYRKDAERYRFIRAASENAVLEVQPFPAGYDGSPYMRLELAWKATPWGAYTPEALDDAVDQAMKS